MLRFVKDNSRYFILGLVVFLIFVYLRFPVEVFRPNFERRLEQILPNSQISIGELSTTLFPGVHLEDIHLQSALATSTYQIESVKLRFRLLPLFLRKLAIGFRVTAPAGKIGGTVTRGVFGRDLVEIDLSLKKLKLKQLFTSEYLQQAIIVASKERLAKTMPVVGGLVGGIKLGGELSAVLGVRGTVSDLQTMNLEVLEGGIELTGENLALEGLVPGVLSLGSLQGDFELMKGRGKINQFKINGKDLSVESKGVLNLKNAPNSSNVNIEVRMNIPESAPNNLKGSINVALLPLGVELKDSGAAFRVTGSLGGRLPPRVVNIP